MIDEEKFQEAGIYVAATFPAFRKGWISIAAGFPAFRKGSLSIGARFPVFRKGCRYIAAMLPERMTNKRWGRTWAHGGCFSWKSMEDR